MRSIFLKKRFPAGASQMEHGEPCRRSQLESLASLGASPAQHRGFTRALVGWVLLRERLGPPPYPPEALCAMTRAIDKRIVALATTTHALHRHLQ